MSGATQDRPLAAVQTLESTVFRLGQLARRLLAEYPDAGLIVDTCHVFGHDDGESSSQLELRAPDVDAVRAVCAALGAEAHTKTVDHHIVMEHVRGETTLDGVCVKVRAFRHFSSEESAVWRAEQDQAATASAQAPGGAE
ncbi:hypothetical protein [Streptomyces sp. NPDC101776]|uniref:hypothetical protein n=1 Tax=Streptomyces sp. NPDC101776 TaxID=3366146 RepID=UPI00381974FF